MGEQVIVLTELTKQYGKFTAVDHIRLSIRKGEIFGLLGPNGAGKSTTILMMLGLTEPTSGIVEICGINSTTHPIEVKRKIGYLPEDVGFYDDMTGPENLMYTARLNGIPDKEAKVKALELMKRVGLEDQLKKKTGKYSRGMRQRLGLADVLIKNPEIIILDEPTVGLDPKQINEIRDLIKGLKQKHTVILSSHILSEVSAVCDYVLIISHGKLVASDTPENLGKLAAGSNNLNLLVKGQKDTIRAALEAVEGVKEVTVKKSPEEGVYAITVGTEENMDVREKVFYSMVNVGCPILEMQSKKVSLEEIFLELTESEKKDKDASGKKSGKSFFKTAADAEKYLNEKNEDTVPDNGLEEKEFDESGEVSNDVSDNGLSADKQDSFAASEEEKGEE